MQNYNKLNFTLFIVLFLTFSFITGKSILASFLLDMENKSAERVEDIKNLREKSYLSDEEFAVFNGESVPVPYTFKDYLAEYNQLDDIFSEKVLGADDNRWIEVSLSSQRLYGWENGRQVYNFVVSTGKWAPTPVGTYRVWTKLKSTTMKGGSKELGTYYYLPNVPCTMYFYKGYGIHGAYWHNNFGHPMSHGCVNMRPSESCELFNWASVGTKVVIHK